MKKPIIAIAAAILGIAAPALAANLANPASQIGGARMAYGISYYLGGADITNEEIPMMLNRVSGRISYSPVRFVNFGVDFGTTIASVDSVSVGGEHYPVFDGGLGLSAGGHIKLSTPYIADIVSFIGIGAGNYFRSSNKRDAYYGGFDVTAAAGLQFRIHEIGTVSFGPQLYLINGENRSADRVKGTYSNVNNLRGWVAFDYFPEVPYLTHSQRPYVSIEFTASPGIGGSGRVPVREFSLSISVGTVTDRLYGSGE